MSEPVTITGLEDWIVDTLTARASNRGHTIEEEIRQIVTAHVTGRREALMARAAALRERTRDRPHPPELDSTRVIREMRDAS